MSIIMKFLKIDEDSAGRILRTFNQLFVAVFLTVILALINGLVGIINAQGSGTAFGALAVAILTIFASILKNRADSGNTSGIKK